MSKVFVVEPPRQVMRGGRHVPVKDMSAAESYGELRYVLPMPAPSSNYKLEPAAIVKMLQDGLRDFSEGDYVMVGVGHPAVLAMALVVIAAKTRGRLNLLHWDNYGTAYRAVSATCWQADDGEALQSRAQPPGLVVQGCTKGGA